MTGTCKLCGGDAGELSRNGAHYLCEARAKHGEPTPCLGIRCKVCTGSGVKPGFRGGVPLFFEEGSARSIAAQFPPCEACDGRGYLYPEGELP